MADDEAEPGLASMPFIAQERIAAHLTLSSMASLNLTCHAIRNSFLANDAVWTQHQLTSSADIHDFASLKRHMLTAKQLATIDPAAHTVHHFQDHIRCACFAPVAADGTQALLTWSSGGAAVLPDVAQPNRQCLLLGSDRPIVSCLCIPTESVPHIASMSTDGTLRFWNLATASPDQAEPDLSGVCQHVCFTYAVKTLRTATALSRCMCTVSTTSGVRLLATGHADSALRLWSLHPLFPGPSKPMATVLRGHGVAVAQLAHHPAIGLLSAGLDHKVKVWDVDAGRCTSTFKVDGSPVCPMQLDPQSQHVLVLTSGSLHRLDPRAPPPTTPTRSTLLTTPGQAQCMTPVLDHMVAIGHSRGAALHDLRMCPGTGGATHPLLRVRPGASVFDLHLDRCKLVAQGGTVKGSTVPSMRDRSLTVCPLPGGGENPLEGVVGEPHMTAMACSGARLVVGTLLGSVAVHDYASGRVGGQGGASGRSKFWKSPSASDEEDV